MINKKRISKISLLISFLLPISGYNNYITAGETLKKEETLKESLTSDDANSLKKIKAVKISSVANNSAKQSNVCTHSTNDASYLWVGTLLWGGAVIYCAWKDHELHEKANDYINLGKKHEDLYNKFVNLEYDIRHANDQQILQLRCEISDIRAQKIEELKYMNKILALMSRLDTDTVCTINCIFCDIPKDRYNMNWLNNAISHYLLSNPSFFCRALFENFFLKTLDDKLQREYAGLLYLVAVIMREKCCKFDGKCRIEKFSDKEKQRINNIINDSKNKNLHVANIESNETYITIKTKNIEGKDSIKIFIPSDKADHFKIEFNSSQK